MRTAPPPCRVPASTEVQRHFLAGVAGWDEEQVPLQRQADGELPAVQRLVDAVRFQAITAHATRAGTAVMGQIDGLLQNYATAAAQPDSAPNRLLRFQHLDAIEHAVYGFFDALADKGRTSPFRDKLRWLLDNVQREHQRLTARHAKAGGEVWTADNPGAHEKADVDLVWQNVLSGQGQLVLSNVFTHPVHADWFESHPGFDRAMLACVARLLSRPVGRALVTKAVGTAPLAPGAKTIALRPQQRAESAGGFPAVTKGGEDARARIRRTDDDSGWEANVGVSPAMQMDTMADSEWRVHDDHGNEILAPAFIILGHELVHAVHNLKGKNRKQVAAYGRGHPRERWVNAEEEQTIAKENELRQEHGLSTPRHEHTKISIPDRAAGLATSVAQDLANLRAQRHFSLTDFTPSNRSGMFDSTLDTTTGEMHVTVRLALRLLSMSTSTATEKEWTRKEADSWVKDLKKGIAKQWNDKGEFALRLPGRDADDLVVRPRFEVEASYTLMKHLTPADTAAAQPRAGRATGGDVATGAAHYDTSVYHGTTAGYRAGGVLGTYAPTIGPMHPAKDDVKDAAKTTHVVNDAIVAGGGRGQAFLFREDAKFMKHNDVLMDMITGSERSLLTRLLGGGHNGQTITVVGGVVAAHSDVVLTRFAQLVKGAYPPPVLRFPLVITGPKADATVVKNRLDALGLNNRLKVVVDPSVATVNVKVDAAYRATSKDKVGSQLTAAHEYGHMLGVPDDYNTLTPKAKAMLANYRHLDPGAGGVDITMDPAYDAGGGSGPKHPVAQEGFIELCGRAGVPVPTSFGMQHNTLMGSGDQMLRHHFATVWDALTTMVADHTRPEWWTIRVPPVRQR